MAPAAMIAPALLGKAEDIASQVMREMRQETVTLRFDEDLDVCGPGEPEAFHVTITPGLITSVGLLAMLIVWGYLAYTQQWKWDPFGLAKFQMPELSMPSLPDI